MHHHLLELRAGTLPLLAVQGPLIPQVEDDEQGGRHDGPLRPQPQRPLERHALEEAEEQRRVAQRREQAGAVGDQEDEEHDDVRRAAPAPVGPEQRADQQGRRPGRPHDVREHGPGAEQRRIAERRARERPLEVDAARDHVQRRDHDHERDVVARLLLEGQAARLSEGGPEVQHDRQRRRRRDEPFVAVRVPPPRRDERADRDGGEQRHER